MANTTINDNAKRITIVPGEKQTRIAWDASDNPVYVGVADRGIASSEAYWFIQKITWTSSLPTLIQTATGAWDSRTGLNYL